MAVTWTPRVTPAGILLTSVAYSPTLDILVGGGFESGGSDIVQFIYSSDGGVTWTRPSFSHSGTPNGTDRIHWAEGAGVFLAVARRFSVAHLWTSPDGITWTARFGPIAVSTNDSAWSEELGLFIEVGTGGYIATSPDGITWTQRTSGVTDALHAVGWSADLGKFVVLSGVNTVLSSTDGITWSSASLGLTSHAFYNRVIWMASLSLFVAVGSRNGLISDPMKPIITSPDGVTWTERTQPVVGAVNGLLGLAFSPTHGLLTITDQHDINPTAVRSMDGITWTEDGPVRAENFSFWPDVTWVETHSRFVAVNNSHDGQAVATGAALPVCSGPQLARPTSLVSNNNGNGSIVGAADVATAIGEVTPDDGAYVRVTHTSAPFDFGRMYITLNPPTSDIGPANFQDHRLRFRARATFDPSLSGGGIEIAAPGGFGPPSYQLVNLTSSFQTYDLSFGDLFAPAGPYAGDYSELQLMIGTSHAGGPSTIPVIEVSWVEVEWTCGYAAGPAEGVTPDEGSELGGTEVTITDDDGNFDEDTEVTFGGVAATNVEIVSPTELTCLTPPHAPGLVDVAAGAVAFPNAFTFLAFAGFPFPTILSITPDEGIVLGGTPVVITGTGFTPNMLIYFGDKLATDIVFVSPTEYQCVTPQHELGVVPVTMVSTTVTEI